MYVGAETLRHQGQLAGADLEYHEQVDSSCLMSNL